MCTFSPCHGLRTPRELFFKNLELLGLGRHFGLKLFETFGVFSAGLSASTHFGAVSSLSIINPYFYTKLSLPIFII